MSLFSASLYLTENSEAIFNQRQDVIIDQLNNCFDVLGLKTMEVCILLILVHSSQKVKEKLEKLGQYSVVMRFKEQGINIGLEGIVEKNNLSDLLVKIRDIKQVLSPYLKRLFENMEPDYFQINDS